MRGGTQVSDVGDGQLEEMSDDGYDILESSIPQMIIQRESTQRAIYNSSLDNDYI